jgi:peptide/nickel transport system substrate-binding protein
MLSNSLQVRVPMRGAELSEGIIGSPRFINPVLAISDADRDMTALVYSGLLKATPSGELIPDLAESYDVSPDGRTYTVIIRPNAEFQDGTPVTSEDVAFTIQKATDPALKSPLRANWQGVSVTIVDPHTITFTLQSSYAPFVDNLTMGILPKHLWQKVATQEFPFNTLNTSPIGAGPFRVSGITKTPAGIATSYDLRSYSHYALGEPYISHLSIRFYDSENALVEALKKGDVESGSSISPVAVSELSESSVVHVPLNRVFGVFFNQNNSPALQDATVRKALSAAIDRKALVDEALSGYAVPLTGPIPPSLAQERNAASSTASADTVAAAKQMLASAGWTPGPGGVLEKSVKSGKDTKTTQLSFTITTSNVPELRAVAELLAKTWSSLGAQVNVQVFDQGDLAENVIRPRKYDALLFGEIIGRGLDLFAFWDSSQRNDPGLNIAMYANPAVDSILAKLRASNDDTDRQSLYAQFEAEIAKDNPAVFLYSPEFIYVVPKDLQGISLGAIENPSDRFETVQSWYRTSDHVWKIFENY